MIKLYSYRFFFFLFLVCQLMTNGCSKPEKTYRIGVDPEWFPLKLEGKALNLFVFSNELLHLIGEKEHIHFKRVNMSWDDLVLGLEDKKYEGVLSSLPLYLFNTAKYDFSDAYLSTGPVLLLRIGDQLSTMRDLKGKVIGVDSTANETIQTTLYPDASVRFFPSAPLALDALVSGSIDAVLLDVILARSYIEDLYAKKLHIVSSPLNDAGIRLVTLKGEHRQLIKAFNQGLSALSDRGIYKELLTKWEL